jgi:hypothetical protein
MGNNVQISKKLFNALYRYHVTGDNSETAYIKAELEDKMKRNTKRILYTEAKTGDTEEIREQAFHVYRNLQKR